MKLRDFLPVVSVTEGVPAQPAANGDLPPPPPDGQPGGQQPEANGDRAGTPLEGVAKWVATGFVLISSLLTFLGLTSDGKLDRILAAYPGPGLIVFEFVGLAVLLAIIAPALPKKPQLGFGLIPAAFVVMNAIVYFTVPDLGAESLWDRANGAGWIVVIVLAGSLVALILITWRRLPIPMNAMAVAIAVIALSQGGYTAMKVAVLSKVPSGVGSISTELKTGGDGSTLDVTVSLAAIDRDHFVEVRTTFADTDTTENPRPRKVAADATGLQTEPMQFLLPVPIPEFATLSVYKCDVGNVTQCEDTGVDTTVRLVADRNARLDLALVQHDDGVHLNLEGAGFPAGTRIMLCVQITDVTPRGETQGGDDADQAGAAEDRSGQTPTEVFALTTSAQADGNVEVAETLPNFPPLTLVEAHASASPESCTDGEPAAGATWTTYQTFVPAATGTTEPDDVGETVTTDPT